MRKGKFEMPHPEAKSIDVVTLDHLSNMKDDAKYSWKNSMTERELERGLQILSIASLISADANNTNDERRENVELLESLKERVDDDLKEDCEKGIILLKNEMLKATMLEHGVYDE